MRLSWRKGVSFGFTSSIITILGLMVGMWAGTGSKLAVIGAIIMIAIADSMSDSLGIHISEESVNKHTHNEIWGSTISTFVSKFLFSLTFLVLILVFPIDMAILISLVWGLAFLTIFSYHLAKMQKLKPGSVIVEHLSIAVFVIILTYFVGELVSKVFGP